MDDSFFMSLPTGQQDLLKKYSQAVEKAPTWLGLTAANERSRFWERHVMDALGMIQSFPEEWKKTTKKILDVGTGNGIPGLPIAILFPSWHVDLIDSDNKKIGFLDKFCIFNEISNVHFFPDRAEKISHQGQRDSYDIVISRALGKLPSALELMSPFAKVGGKVIVSHGTSWKQEMASSEKAMKSLNIKFVEYISYLDDDRGVLLVFNKEDLTPAKYPRRTGVPAKRPL